MKLVLAASFCLIVVVGLLLLDRPRAETSSVGVQDQREQAASAPPLPSPKRKTRAHIPVVTRLSPIPGAAPELAAVSPEGAPSARDVTGEPFSGPLVGSVAQAREAGLTAGFAKMDEQDILLADRKLGMLEKLDACTGKLQQPGEMLSFLKFTVKDGVATPAGLELRSSSFDEGDDVAVYDCLDKIHRETGPLKMTMPVDGETFYWGATIRLPRGYDPLFAALRGP